MDTWSILDRLSRSEISHEKALCLIRQYRKRQLKPKGKRVWALSLRVRSQSSRSIRLWLPWGLVSAVSRIALHSAKVTSKLKDSGANPHTVRELIREVGRHGGGLLVDVEENKGDCVKIRM